VRGHGRLHHDGAVLRVDAGGQIQRGDLAILARSFAGLLVDRDGVQIDDAEDALVIVLDAHPVLEGAQVVADVQISGWLHAGEDSCFHGKGTGVNPIVSNFEVTVEKLVYGGDGLARLDGRVVLAPFVLPGERIRAKRNARSRAWCTRGRWKCWRRRRNGWPPAARYSAAAADATISTRRTNTSSPPSAPSWRRSCGGWEDRAAGRDRGGGPSRGDIATARSCTSKTAEARLSRAALAQAVRDRRLPHRVAQDQPGHRRLARCCRIRDGRVRAKPSKCSPTRRQCRSTSSTPGSPGGAPLFRVVRRDAFRGWWRARSIIGDASA
jgi:hypothetical protein